MPAGTVERTAPSSVAATPASVSTTPEKPRSFSESRKSSKPIMEKRRRARINESLAQLKTLILHALKKDSSRHSKLEKADILEMTVKHLRNLQRIQMTAAVSSEPAVLGKYRCGFSECVGEVTRFLSACDGVSADVGTRLLGHLAACACAVNFSAQRQTPVYVPAALAHVNGVPRKGVGVGVTVTADAGKIYGDYSLVQTPDGQFAFAVPGVAFAPSGAQGSQPAPAASPAAPPAASPDSVWRPW